MGVVLFIVASAGVAGRLLLLFKQLKQPPELFLGLAYLLAGTLGWGGLLIGALTTPAGQSLAEGYQAWSVIVGDVGTLFFYLFVWYVFRRDSVLARAFVALVLVVFLAALVRDTWLVGVTFGHPPGTVTTIAAAVCRALVFAWMAAEAFTSYGAFRRRARVGLGNALVQNRLLLWGLSAVAMFAIATVAFGLFVTARDVVDATHRQNEAGAVYGGLAAFASVLTWLAFYPPRAYRNWVEKTVEQVSHGGQ